MWHSVELSDEGTGFRIYLLPFCKCGQIRSPNFAFFWNRKENMLVHSIWYLCMERKKSLIRDKCVICHRLHPSWATATRPMTRFSLINSIYVNHVTVMRNVFLMCLFFGNQRSPPQLVTFSTRYIRSAISTLGNAPLMCLSSLNSYRTCSLFI